MLFVDVVCGIKSQYRPVGTTGIPLRGGYVILARATFSASISRFIGIIFGGGNLVRSSASNTFVLLEILILFLID